VLRLDFADRRDVPAIAALLEELERFYGTVDFPPLDQREQQIAALLFGPAPAARVVLAYDESDAVIGLASFSTLWPAAGTTASLYLKELYVAAKYRSQGVGTRLVARVCALAVEAGCSRVEWAADRDNPGAQAFYQRLGTSANETKLSYRVDGDDLTRLARLG
jgi:GNAT superfamily N-acetyltransferase